MLKLDRLREKYEQDDRGDLLPDLDIALLSRYILYADQYDAVAEFVKAIND